jgi:hypothetical protein
MPAFEFYRLRFRFRASETVRFPRGKAANTLRGGFGLALRAAACAPECPGARDCPRSAECDYARIFEPRAAGDGPSGLADRPRPFVLRAAHLDGVNVAPGSGFDFDVHVFDLLRPALDRYAQVFAQLAGGGLGPGRGRAHLAAAERLDLEGRTLDGGGLKPLALPLEPAPEPVRRVRVAFVTPAELKGMDPAAPAPPFDVLFARARDRLSTLRALYGPGPLDVDFSAMRQRAASVRLASHRIERVTAERKSLRTGEVHPLGGFTGEAVYEGDLAEFLPWLQAARWTGVGRQTVWGKGEIRVEV